MTIQLRPYQNEVYQKTLEKLQDHKAVLISAGCGFGKSVLIAHLANELPNRVLILTHRQELLEQNSKLITDHATLTAKTKKPQILKDAKVVVCMAQTIIRRIEKYGHDYAGDFQTIIIDETHLDFFAKVYNLIPHQNRIGLTATPILNKTETCVINGEDYTRRATLAKEYDHLIQGIPEAKLIELGYLVRDFNIQLQPPDLDKLKSSSSNPDGYTSTSLTDVFGSHASIDTLYQAYEKYGKGKKTIVFNPTTKSNLTAYNHFVDKLGKDKVRLYDSVNETEYSRDETVQWFKSIPDAILLNVGVFTTGFDVPELEVILFNKKTKSLGLFLQIAGRGSRPAPQINKDKFLFVDMGLNLPTHGKWSDNRDWQKHFKPQTWKRKRQTDLLQIWECKNCGFFNIKGTLLDETTTPPRIVCNDCHEPKPPQPETKHFIKGKFVVLEQPVYPNAIKLIEYAKRVGGDGNMVLKMAKAQILDLFQFHTTAEDYQARRGRYIGRIGELFRPVYFSVLRDGELKGKNRKLTTELESILGKVEEVYN